jgi:thioredoxin-like negative regulator of GroEL
MGCQKMKPIVHGLETTYKGRLDVLYFDVSDKKNADLQRKLQFRATPHLILLRKDGERVKEWAGVIVPEKDLKTAIDALVDGRR